MCTSIDGLREIEDIIRAFGGYSRFNSEKTRNLHFVDLQTRPRVASVKVH